MGMIFYLSSQEASLSTITSDWFYDLNFIQFFVKFFRVFHIEISADFIRSFAHPAEFCVLGFFVYLTIFSYKDYKYSKCILFSILFCMFYAASDEIHQIFVAGRACELFDWMVDSLGAILGINISY